MGILILLDGSGCNKGPISKTRLSDAEFDRPLAAVPVRTPGGQAAVFRLSGDVLRRRQELHYDPLVIPLGSAQVSVGLRETADAPKNKTSGAERSNQLLRVAAGATASAATFNLMFLADHYNVLEVTMQADNGTECRFSWTGDLENSAMGNPGVSARIQADAKPHSYRLPLRTGSAGTWAGQIRSVTFFPSDQPANVEVTELKLVYEPPRDPLQVTINGETHAALHGTQPPWDLEVPPDATLDFYLGMPQRAWNPGHDGRARFRVTVSAVGQPEATLLDQELHPRVEEAHRAWIPFEADLGQYAGQRVRLHFTVEYPGPSDSGYAFWGDPMVFARNTGEASVPVVLIVLDGIQAGHLSCYGYDPPTTPRLDALAKEAVLFENAYCQAVACPVSLDSILTGRYPNPADAPETGTTTAPTLATQLRDAGYVSAAFLGANEGLLAANGFARGFDLHSVPEMPVRTLAELRPDVEGWLSNHPIGNSFILLHVDDLRPRLTPEPRASAQVTLYDDTIRAVDAQLGPFFEKLASLGLYDRALIVVAGDRGMAFGEHGTDGPDTPYEASVRVPLIIRLPKGEHAGTRETRVVQLVDLLPTVLGVTGASTSTQTDGHDLAQRLAQPGLPGEKAFMQGARWRAVRSGAWKLIYNLNGDTFELYDLVNDPGEKTNRYNDAPADLDALKRELLAFFKAGFH